MKLGTLKRIDLRGYWKHEAIASASPVAALLCAVRLFFDTTGHTSR